MFDSLISAFEFNVEVSMVSEGNVVKSVSQKGLLKSVFSLKIHPPGQNTHFRAAD